MYDKYNDRNCNKYSLGLIDIQWLYEQPTIQKDLYTRRQLESSK